jgi:phosphoglycerate dehydrogenase-like enzyme
MLAVSDRAEHAALELSLAQLDTRLPADTLQLQRLVTAAAANTPEPDAPLPWDSIGWESIRPETEVVAAAHWGPRTQECYEEILRRAPRLRWLHTLSAGVNHLPLEALHRAGVVVTHHQGVSDSPLVEYALAGLLHFLKQVPRLKASQAAKRWDQFDHCTAAGATLAVLGWGSIGQAVGRAARHGLGMRVVALTRRPKTAAEIGDGADEGVASPGC